MEGLCRIAVCSDRTMVLPRLVSEDDANKWLAATALKYPERKHYALGAYDILSAFEAAGMTDDNAIDTANHIFTVGAIIDPFIVNHKTGQIITR